MGSRTRAAGSTAIESSGPLNAVPTTLEFPPDRTRLDAFFDGLSALKAGQGRRARIAFWGDSHVAGEMLPGRLRSRLQGIFGDGGPGFVLLGQPWRSYRHMAVKLGATKRWRAERIWSRYSRRRPRPRDDLFGLAGISVHARRAARTWLEPRGQRTLAALDLYYLRQPGGGKLEVQADGRRVKLLLTIASRKEPAYARVKLPRGTRRVELITGRTGEVRLFGADVESGAPGVVLDTFGINGARASTVLKWNERLMGHQLRQLAPDLLVLAYGSNEVDSSNLTQASFGASFDTLLTRMRKAAPKAACLVLGPPDQARFDKAGLGWRVPGSLDWLVAEQRRLALLRGCAFWDQRAAMGGSRGVFAWVRADPPLARSDHVHLSARGYRAISDALADALLSAWRSRRCRVQPSSCASSDAGGAQ